MADPAAARRSAHHETAERRGPGERLRALIVETRSVMPAAGATGLPLILVVAAMCFLASLALGTALTVGHTSAEWARELSGALTVEVKPSPAMSQADQTDAVLNVLSGTQGVLSARALTSADVAGLLEPWLGQGNVTEDLPLPHLVDVRIDPNSPPDFDALAERIAAAAPGARLDTHRRWHAELIRTAHSVEWLAYAVLAVVAATTIAIVTFATRAGLSANREVVEVLNLIGARDRFIAAEIERHFLHLGLRGGAIGLALSVATFLALGQYGHATSLFLVPASGLRPEFYPALLPVPLIAALVALVTARLTVIRTLHRLL
ncbi:MAG: FtsX-like permease family protein [Parvibaculum sp.]|uniref:cell division protein FtsX n=1 Tax=Parvibaculum sp. TaxID=2024848 RepID=UPI003C78A37C